MQVFLIHMNKYIIKKCHGRSRTVHLAPKSNVLSNSIAKAPLKSKTNYSKLINRSKRGGRSKNLLLRWNLKLIFQKSKTEQVHVPLKIYLEVD